MKLVANDTKGNFKIVCEETRLVEVYKGICEKYPWNREGRKEKYDVKELLELIRSQGYNVKYYSRDYFYEIQIPNNVGWVSCEMEIRRGCVGFSIIIKIEDDWYMVGNLGYYIREIAGVKTISPSMVSYDEAIDMLNTMVGVIKEILDKWTRE